MRQINKQKVCDKLTSKKYAKTINLLCADNKVFVKYQAQRGEFQPQTPPCVRPWFRIN